MPHFSEHDRHDRVVEGLCCTRRKLTCSEKSLKPTTNIIVILVSFLASSEGKKYEGTIGLDGCALLLEVATMDVGLPVSISRRQNVPGHRITVPETSARKRYRFHVSGSPQSLPMRQRIVRGTMRSA